MTVFKVWTSLYKNWYPNYCVLTSNKEGTLEGPNKRPKFWPPAFLIRSSHNIYPINSPSACKGGSVLLFLRLD